MRLDDSVAELAENLDRVCANVVGILHDQYRLGARTLRRWRLGVRSVLGVLLLAHEARRVDLTIVP